MKQDRKIRKFKKLLSKINSYKETMRELSDQQLSGLTEEFRERLQCKETLDDILPEAFAAVREADRRILGMFPFDVQVLGAIALHKGYLAEMNTGEGKTLVATMPLYLNGLTGEGAILVTTNEYLALRDFDEMGPVYRFMGLSVSVGVQMKGDPFTNAEKKEIYNADILYTTHGVLGFDYLLNNLVSTVKDRFLRRFNYIIIDEADYVLLDGAQTPLVISGSPRVQSNLYQLADFFVTTLEKNIDYEVEDKKVWLTESGIKSAEKFFQIDNFYQEEHFEMNRHVILALRAHALFEKGKDYMISNEGELVLLDNGSGRVMPGVKLRGGQHQALEVKEKLADSRENRSMASITYQNLFLLFKKMSGMSGTISDAREELRDVYGEEVVVIPANRQVIREDRRDCYYRDSKTQFEAALALALKTHKTGQPVLIVVSTIAETEKVSKRLREERIPHSVLNANNAFWEADMIKEAGQMYAVTVSTAMAGRGTDIKLGEGVKELGGLAVIGIGRMANTRHERQVRGRAGRQGDPGFSQFFISIEDDVVARNQFGKIEKYLEGKKKISTRKAKKYANRAQELEEEYAMRGRKAAMDYDQILKKQRELIYALRDRLLDGEMLRHDEIMKIAGENIKQFLDEATDINKQSVNRYLLDHLSYRTDSKIDEINFTNVEQAKEYLLKRAQESIEEQREKLGNEQRMNEFLRIAALSAIDEAWIEEVDYLQQLQAAVSGRIAAQRNPLFEYQSDAFESYNKMERRIRENIIRNILLSNVYVDQKRKLHILLP